MGEMFVVTESSMHLPFSLGLRAITLALLQCLIPLIGATAAQSYREADY